LADLEIQSNLASDGTYLTTIPDSAFKGCSSLSFIYVPNGITTIANSAFQNCYRISTILIPNTVTYIGYNVFAGIISLIVIIFFIIHPHY
jgi:hypothetical protein